MVKSPIIGLDTKTYWLTDRQSQCDFDFDFDQVGGVSDETVKYGREFWGTSTQEWQLWQGLEAIVQVNYRPIHSSERVPHIKKPTIVRQKTKIWPWAPDVSPTPRQTGRLTVSRILTSTLTPMGAMTPSTANFLFYHQESSIILLRLRNRLFFGILRSSNLPFGAVWADIDKSKHIGQTFLIT
jgi:hypothetical protein